MRKVSGWGQVSQNTSGFGGYRVEKNLEVSRDWIIFDLKEDVAESVVILAIFHISSLFLK